MERVATERQDTDSIDRIGKYDNIEVLMPELVTKKSLKYPMRTKRETPLFNYIVMRSGDSDYWLYEEFDDAVNKAKSLDWGDESGLIYECYFNAQTREYRAQNTFRVSDGKMYYDKYAKIEMHVKSYVDAGRWMNPNPEWVRIIEADKAENE